MLSYFCICSSINGQYTLVSHLPDYTVLVHTIAICPDSCFAESRDKCSNWFVVAFANVPERERWHVYLKHLQMHLDFNYYAQTQC